MQNETPQPLQVIVVGAGIGGLAAAIGLQNEGHSVVICEKSKFTKEIGAAVTLGSNLNGPFEKLNINPEQFGANAETVRILHTKDGVVYQTQDLSAAPARLSHRVDLHRALKEAALDAGVEIRLQCQIASLDSDDGSITMTDGGTLTADLIIAADGIHSAMRKYIVPSAPEPTQFYRYMFRMLIPCSTLAASTDTRGFLDPPGKMTIFTSDDGRRVVCYPCRANTIMNVVALFPTSLAKTYSSTQELQDHMTELFADFHSSARALLAAADEPSSWPLYDLPALDTWSCGRAVLIGDAAHPTLPYTGQGAAQAIEDAVTLAVLLGKGTRANEVQDRLQLFYATRFERTKRIQDFSCLADQLTPNKSESPAAIAAEFFRGVFNHDACAFAEQKLKEHLKAVTPSHDL
jgi:salicylate hydroxylase